MTSLDGSWSGRIGSSGSRNFRHQRAQRFGHAGRIRCVGGINSSCGFDFAREHTHKIHGIEQTIRQLPRIRHLAASHLAEQIFARHGARVSSPEM